MKASHIIIGALVLFGLIMMTHTIELFWGGGGGGHGGGGAHGGGGGAHGAGGRHAGYVQRRQPEHTFRYDVTEGDDLPDCNPECPVGYTCGRLTDGRSVCVTDDTKMQ